MKKLFIILALVLIISISLCHASALRQFQLNDGSSFQGIIEGVRSSDGFYKINSPGLGIIYINPDNILSMMTVAANQSSAPLSPTNTAVSSQKMEQTQQMLLADPAINQSAQDLASDPEIAALLQDPQVMQIIMSQDVEAIQSNPKIQQLLQHPQMQQLIQQAGQKIMQQQ